MINPRLSTEFGILVFFTNSGFIEFQMDYLPFFQLFSVIDSFTWFWMESRPNNTHLKLEFLETLFFVLFLYFYSLMTFLMMLCVILLPILIIYSKCQRVYDLWQELEVTSKLESGLKGTIDWVRKRLADFNAGKTQLVLVGWCNNSGAVDGKMDGLTL